MSSRRSLFLSPFLAVHSHNTSSSPPHSLSPPIPPTPALALSLSLARSPSFNLPLSLSISFSLSCVLKRQGRKRERTRRWRRRGGREQKTEREEEEGRGHRTQCVQRGEHNVKHRESCRMNKEVPWGTPHQVPLRPQSRRPRLQEQKLLALHSWRICSSNPHPHTPALRTYISASLLFGQSLKLLTFNWYMTYTILVQCSDTLLHISNDDMQW
jgi:hypothetical protein